MCVFSIFIFKQTHCKVQAATPVFIYMDMTEGLKGIFGERTFKSDGDPGSIGRIRHDLWPIKPQNISYLITYVEKQLKKVYKLDVLTGFKEVFKGLASLRV